MTEVVTEIERAGIKKGLREKEREGKARTERRAKTKEEAVE